MKGASFCVVGLLALLLAAAAIAQQSPPVRENPPPAPSPPPSLDALYPPRADGPRWLLAMFEMGTTFSGMVGDFMERDFANADKGFADFKARYAKLAGMVPEWAADLPAAPIDALGEALKTRDPARFMPAVDAAGAVCHTCHVRNMARVQQKYHWGDFSGLTVVDPVSKGEVPYRVFMQMLDGDLAGVQVDAAQGQLDMARDHAKGLAVRYQALGESCGACHESERHYFVSADITGMVARLPAALDGPAGAAKGVEPLVRGIGMESCHKCHLVHAPAALARHVQERGR